MTDQNKTATAIRREVMAMEVAQHRLRMFPSEQAEAIARHYVSLAHLSLSLLKLVEMRELVTDTKDADAAIDHCVEAIKKSHRDDFGIELDWL